jgi:hypothetical protein
MYVQIDEQKNTRIKKEKKERKTPVSISEEFKAGSVANTPSDVESLPPFAFPVGSEMKQEFSKSKRKEKKNFSQKRKKLAYLYFLVGGGLELEAVSTASP